MGYFDLVVYEREDGYYDVLRGDFTFIEGVGHVAALDVARAEAAPGETIYAQYADGRAKHELELA